VLLLIIINVRTANITSLTVTVVEIINTLMIVTTMNAVIAKTTVVVIVFTLIVIDITAVTIIKTHMGGEAHLQAAAEGVLSAGGLPQDQSASLPADELDTVCPACRQKAGTLYQLCLSPVSCL